MCLATDSIKSTLASAFPYADIVTTEERVIASCKVLDNKPTCMKCGSILEDMSNKQLGMEGKWEDMPKRSHSDTKQHVCFSCNKHGSVVPLRISRKIANSILKPKSPTDNGIVNIIDARLSSILGS